MIVLVIFNRSNYLDYISFVVSRILKLLHVTNLLSTLFSVSIPVQLVWYVFIRNFCKA